MLSEQSANVDVLRISLDTADVFHRDADGVRHISRLSLRTERTCLLLQ